MAREQRITEVFVEIADTLIDDFDVLDLLQRLSTRCVELLDVASVGILLADVHGDLRTVAASDERTQLLELFALQHEQGPCVECYRSGQPRTNIDLSRRETTMAWAQFATHARRTGYAVTHAIPLRLRRRNVGALSLFQTEPRHLDDDDLVLAQALADVATIAILQQRTLEQSHVEKGQLQTALNNRILIEQAKGLLAERWDTSPDEAFATFRKYARARHLRLAELAHQVIDGSYDTTAILAEAAPHAGKAPSNRGGPDGS
ncbi:ANTAR domain-containing protein [Streptomyces sp. NPDC002564]|uniref:ANTAR domain-containing protein n=1 Tax=Streptomyces sp. NPDC002564 TaxID=3364649 RepID=UPI0036BE76B9